MQQLTGSRHAEVCPVCKGSGKVKGSVGGVGQQFTVFCHGCDGRGWVQVGGEQVPLYVTGWPWDLWTVTY
jgi:DnaJ-class molecular chaperone